MTPGTPWGREWVPANMAAQDELSKFLSALFVIIAHF